MVISNKTKEIADLRIPPQVTSQSDPWLVMCNGVKKESQTFFSISKDWYYAKSILELTNKKIFCNCKEWLVLSDYDSKKCSLLNIISMEKVELPSHDYLEETECNLTCPPEDPNCYVVFTNPIDLTSSICRPGDDKYINRKAQLLEQGDVCHISIACLNGSIYGIGFPSLSLHKANLNDPNFQFQTVINGESMQKELLYARRKHYLIESSGDILLVIRLTLHERSCVFHIFRADFFTSKWELLRNIGDRTIFLGPVSSQGISCSSSESGIQGNCIYYMDEMNRALYVFNIEDQSMTVSIPCSTINLINFTPQWVMVGSTTKCVL